MSSHNVFACLYWPRRESSIKVNPLPPKVRKIVKKEKKKSEKEKSVLQHSNIFKHQSFLVFVAVKKKENF